MKGEGSRFMDGVGSGQGEGKLFRSGGGSSGSGSGRRRSSRLALFARAPLGREEKIKPRGTPLALFAFRHWCCCYVRFW